MRLGHKAGSNVSVKLMDWLFVEEEKIQSFIYGRHQSAFFLLLLSGEQKKSFTRNKEKKIKTQIRKSFRYQNIDTKRSKNFEHVKRQKKQNCYNQMTFRSSSNINKLTWIYYQNKEIKTERRRRQSCILESPYWLVFAHSFAFCDMHGGEKEKAKRFLITM